MLLQLGPATQGLEHAALLAQLHLRIDRPDLAEASVKDMQAMDDEAALTILAAAQVALFGFLSAVAAGDLPAARALLADDVVVRSDGGGRYTAARLPVVGADRVLKLYQGLGRLGVPTRVEPRVFNGQPGILAAFDTPPAGFAGQWAMVADVVEGRIVALYSVLVEEKVPGW